MKFMRKNKEAIFMTISCVASIFVSILANKICEQMMEIQNHPQYIVKYIIDVIVVYIVSKGCIWLKNKFFLDVYQEEVIQQALISMRDLQNQWGEIVQELWKNNPVSEKCLAKQSLGNIKAIIEQCFSFFDNVYSENKSLINAIDFEVTFMTKSYVDNFITIPAAANRERRQPTSMIHRKDNVHIYDETVTAAIYEEYNRGEKPDLRIVENTNKSKNEKESYKFLYKGQGDRIKSSMVMPIMSCKNELLGTLVVHCNKKYFFKMSRKKFWKALLEIYAGEIANEKKCLDILVEKADLQDIF